MMLSAIWVLSYGENRILPDKCSKRDVDGWLTGSTILGGCSLFISLSTTLRVASYLCALFSNKLSMETTFIIVTTYG